MNHEDRLNEMAIQKELLQGYYNRIKRCHLSVEDILEIMEADFEYLAMEGVLIDAEKIIIRKPKGKMKRIRIFMKLNNKLRYHMFLNHWREANNICTRMERLGYTQWYWYILML